MNASQKALKKPKFLKASIAYCEHVGVKRQELGKNGDNSKRYALTNTINNLLIIFILTDC
jgi:hypothetical protein